ncbi:MAG: sugar phosphate isomerase/epimerase [Anaerolineales bacterium]|nr:sugar phosphate isomerase/epimerase [Anaerolineales bacterium]
MTIPIILSTGSLFNFDVDTAMCLAKETGFDGIELMVDWRRETYTPGHLQQCMARYDLPILAVHSPFRKSFLADWPSDPIDSIKASVRLAETLGAQTVIVHPPGRWLRMQGLITMPDRSHKISLPLPVVGEGQLGHWLRHDLATFQSKTAVKIAVENMPCRWFGPIQMEPHHYYDPDMLSRFQYLTFDTTHVGTRRTDLLAFFQKVEPQVAHIHLSNFNGKEHQLPKHGFLSLTDLLKRLKKQAFPGLISLELNPTSLQADDESKLKENLRDSLSFCLQALQ